MRAVSSAYVELEDGLPKMVCRVCMGRTAISTWPRYCASAPDSQLEELSNRFDRDLFAVVQPIVTSMYRP